MSTVGRVGVGCLVHTIENRSDKGCGEVGLLLSVQRAQDLWGVEIIDCCSSYIRKTAKGLSQLI